MTWLLIVGGVLLGVGLVAWLVGAMLPANHVARMTVDLSAEPARVWSLISDVGGTARWRPAITAVEMQPPVNGRVRFTEIGRERMPFEMVAQEAPTRQVVRVVDDGLPFGGTWTWELMPVGPGTRLTITEDGFVRNPVFRVMGRFFFSPTATMSDYLRDLSRELGDSAEPQVIRKR